MESKFLNHFGAKIVDEWSDKCDFYIYEESTADGYSVYVATDNTHNILVNENIYYYDSDLGEALLDALKYGKCKNIYVDDPSAYWVEDVLEEGLIWLEEQNEEDGEYE